MNDIFKGMQEKVGCGDHAYVQAAEFINSLVME